MRFFLITSLSLIFISSNAQNNSWYDIERFNPRSGKPEYIIFKIKIEPGDFTNRIRQVKDFENVDLQLINAEADPQGNMHLRYRQMINGVAVMGSMITAHCHQGNVYSFNAAIFDAPKVSAPLQTANASLESVLNSFKGTKFYFQQNDADRLLKEATGDENASFKPVPELMILPAELNEADHVPAFAYAIDLFAAAPLWHKVFYIDAVTLKVLFTEDKIQSIEVPAKAKTKYSGTQDIITDSVQPKVYRLYESSRGTGNGVHTFNMQKGTVYTTSKEFNDTDNYWNNVNLNMDEISGDVHWGAEKTYDFYKTVFNRNSIDNNGFRLTSYAHYSTNYVNAFWNGYFMTYGDGGSGYLPLTSLDVCGHEITHGLTQKTAALVYSNESGALNESFSDIFGVSIDFFTLPATANFRIGEQFGPGGTGLRDMKDPAIYLNPGTYKGTFWVSGKSDNGGVHYNSGVQNKWFYLLCHGDTGVNDFGYKYKVDSIGMLKAAQIAYRTLTVYLTPLSTYEDARFYSILSAKELFGECSTEANQVIMAWNAVGVGNNTIQLKADFTSIKTTSCSIPFTASFRNNSTGGSAYHWDFGDGQFSSLVNPSHIYTAIGNYNVKLVVTGCLGGQDSVTFSQFIKVDPALPECQKIIMPVSGVGSLITTCSGLIRDDGDTSEYGNLVYSTRSIAPPGTSALKLTVNVFDLEDGFDFLYIYDGPDTLGKLLGKFTGLAIPPIFICKSGSATLRFTSDYLVGGQGFEIAWQCIAKTPVDYALQYDGKEIFGRKLTSSALGANSKIEFDLVQKGTQQLSAVDVKYRLNNGSVSSKSIAVSSGTTRVSLSPFDFSSTGAWLFEAWVEQSQDGVKENDTVKINIKQVDNTPVTLPLIENFDATTDVWLYENSHAIGGNSHIDYENSSPQGRLRTFAGSDMVYGTHSITLDKSDRNWLFDTIPQTNFLVLTYNMGAVAALPSPLLFRFQFNNHGDKQYPNDNVWVRGNDTAAWIKFYDLFANKSGPGILKLTPIFNLNYFLDSAGQRLSSSFQLRFGQQDQNSAINVQQYAGYTFDNLRFSTWNTGISNKAESLVSIYPNPASNYLEFHTLKQVIHISMTDMNGKLVGTFGDPGSDYFGLDCSQYARGNYLISFTFSDGSNSTEKVILR
jgi:Zn-dependent metalloprotease